MKRLSLAISLLLLPACQAPASDGAAAEQPVRSSSLPEVAVGPTTGGDLALSNLDAQIVALERSAERTLQLAQAQQLLGLWLTRVQFTGSFDDFERAQALADRVIAQWPARPESWLMQADVLSSVHRFEEALEALDEAEGLGAPTQSARRGTYRLALGDQLEPLYAERSAALEHVASYDTQTDAAAAAAAIGHFDEADALYRKALRGYHDVSPLPLAWVQFQRGVMWGEMANQPERARPLYEAAVALLPGYVVANVHLAELEAGAGEMDAAVERLSPLVEGTRDPEPAGKLAGYLADTDPARAEPLRAQAERGYDVLLARHPAAFLDHAAEFFASTGDDPARALQLAQRNLALRPNARAYLVALNAAEANGERNVRCELARDARDVSALSGNLNLSEVAGDALAECKP